VSLDSHTFAARSWSQLIAQLREAEEDPSVAPVVVVGSDAILVEGGPHGAEPIDQWLARRVAEHLELPRGASPISGDEVATLNDITCRWMERGYSIEDVYGAVKEVLDETPPPIPSSLRRLARVSPLQLFVTTTPDDLMARALDAERPHDRLTLRLAYQPKAVQDLPAPLSEIRGRAVVYQLLGRASTAPVFAVTEEDTLEFVHSLQSESRRPKLLSDELRDRKLIVLGSGYSGWLARFFLRVAKVDRILHVRKADVMADARASADASLTSFLHHYSSQTTIFGGGAIQFIDELVDRWEAQRGSAMGSVRADAAHLMMDEIRPCAIFISYASEDRRAADALAFALRAAKLPVWFDRNDLNGGDEYERIIRRGIESASLFVPILSKSVRTRQRSFFRVEWSIAADVARRAYGSSLPFIVPVRIDDFPHDAPELPEEIRAAHWLELSEGASLEPIVERLRELYRDYQLSVSGVL
jgi:hypothetical protein